jgi:hypothetical protein
MIVLVPTDFEKARNSRPLDWYNKPSTMVGCITGDANAMKAITIVDRATMEDDLQLYGYDAEKVHLVSQFKAFMTTSFFMIWAAGFLSDNRGSPRPNRLPGSRTTDFGWI